jgi:hypothetical protein
MVVGIKAFDSFSSITSKVGVVSINRSHTVDSSFLCLSNLQHINIAFSLFQRAIAKILKMSPVKSQAVSFSRLRATIYWSWLCVTQSWKDTSWWHNEIRVVGNFLVSFLGNYSNPE